MRNVSRTMGIESLFKKNKNLFFALGDERFVRCINSLISTEFPPGFLFFLDCRLEKRGGKNPPVRFFHVTHRLKFQVTNTINWIGFHQYAFVNEITQSTPFPVNSHWIAQRREEVCFWTLPSYFPVPNFPFHLFSFVF